MEAEFSAGKSETSGKKTWFVKNILIRNVSEFKSWMFTTINRVSKVHFGAKEERVLCHKCALHRRSAAEKRIKVRRSGVGACATKAVEALDCSRNPEKALCEVWHWSCGEGW